MAKAISTQRGSEVLGTRDGSNGLTQHFDVTDLLSLVTIVPQANHYKVLFCISLNNLIKIPKYPFVSSTCGKNKTIETTLPF